MSEESLEFEQKLADLQRYGEQYDQAEQAMCASGSQEEVVAQWRLKMEAEKKYLEIYDWFVSRGYFVVWNRREQRYDLRRRSL